MEKKKFVILVIDDDPADVEILRRLLEQIEGWEIKFLGCNNGGTGRAEALRCQPDLIFLDYLLGVETGLEVFHEMRKGGCNLPVIMLTGHGSEEVAVEAMKAGVSDYLVKGRITPDRLRLVISNAVQKFERQQKIEEQRKALRPDLLLRDLNFPRIDGREVLEQIWASLKIREREHYP